MIFSPEISDAIVIGAGPAGLAASRELQRTGVDHQVLERGSTVGHSWTTLYDSLVLHTGKHLSALPGLPYPAATPLFPTRQMFLDYLRRYAETFRLPVETGVDVTSIKRTDNRWLLSTGHGTARQARTLVIATGIVTNPFVPELPGRDQFRGQLLHSVAYHRPDDVRGRRVLVAGTGNSGGEIAAELAHAGAAVTLSVRTGATIVPRQVLGLPVQYLGFVFSPLPRGAQAAITRGFAALTGLLRGKPVLPPPSRTGCSKIPLIGLHLANAIRAGQVALRPGIARFTPAGVQFDDRTSEDFDVVILATGYRAAVSPLGDLIHVDECGFASRRDRVASADQPALFFVGHTYNASGAIYNIGRDARLAAGAVKAYLSETRQT